MTRQEYLNDLKAYINEAMANLPNDGIKRDLKFWVNFNKEKEVEFQTKLNEQGITVVP